MDDTLGSRLRTLRRQRGLSMRKLTTLIGLSAHSNLADYEADRRIPPVDIVNACERVLQVSDGELLALRRAALATSPRPSPVRCPPDSSPELQSTAQPAPSITVPDGLPASRKRRRALVIAAAVVVAGILAVAVRPAPAPAIGVSSCDRSAVVLDSAPLTAPQNSTILGTVSLRYSPSCSLAWTRFIPGRTSVPGATGVVLSVHRVTDGATTDLPLDQVVAAESDPLLTVPGCVYAEATITFQDGHTISGRTHCRQS